MTSEREAMLEALENCPHVGALMTEDDMNTGKSFAESVDTQFNNAADWFIERSWARHGVSVEDVIGCINKRVGEYQMSAPDKEFSRPMNDVELQLCALVEDIRALAQPSEPECPNADDPHREHVGTCGLCQPAPEDATSEELKKLIALHGEDDRAVLYLRLEQSEAKLAAYREAVENWRGEFGRVDRRYMANILAEFDRIDAQLHT